jgi:hypothetical protein
VGRLLTWAFRQYLVIIQRLLMTCCSINVVRFNVPLISILSRFSRGSGAKSPGRYIVGRQPPAGPRNRRLEFRRALDSLMVLPGLLCARWKRGAATVVHATNEGRPQPLASQGAEADARPVVLRELRLARPLECSPHARPGQERLHSFTAQHGEFHPRISEPASRVNDGGGAWLCIAW